MFKTIKKACNDEEQLLESDAAYGYLNQVSDIEDPAGTRKARKQL